MPPILQESVDSRTNQPISTARVRFSREAAPDVFFSANADERGHFEFVVPARPFSFTISAPGYKSWLSNAGKERLEVIILAGATKEVVVALEPDRVN